MTTAREISVENGNKIRDYVLKLNNFEIQNENSTSYEHMGATLTDAALQAGLNYKNVVQPRVLNVKQKYPAARTTTGFLRVLSECGKENVINWKGEKKLTTLMKLAEFLQSERVETEQQLAEWLQIEDRREVLLAIRGIGPKTYDYLWLLSALDAVAVDVHLFRFAQKAGVNGDYETIGAAIKAAADSLNCTPAQLDKAIWIYQSRAE